ncbi:putative reverse transcriptase domain-containing protein [Tanacetum coccineum]
MSTSRQGMSSKEMEQIVAQRVANAIEASAIYELKIRMAHDSMNQVNRRIGVVRAYATRAGNRKAYAGNLPYCNKSEAMAAYEVNQNNRNKDGNPNVNAGGVVSIAHECTYQDFMKCQPLNFKGNEGVIGLTRWFEKMESVFHINNCLQKYQVKYASCTMQDSALTWWNSHKWTIGNDASYAMTWKALMKLMTEVYYPRNEIQKMETELWNLAVRGNDLTAYTQRFRELILLCTKMVPKEEDGVEKFIGGHPIISKEMNADNKRGFDNNPRDNREQQPPFKRQNVARVYMDRNIKNKGYAGILPLCDKCKLRHHGPFPVRCGNCKKVGHQARACWASTTMTCYGRGGKLHTKRYFP